MAKQKDQGENLEIYYDNERDSLRKFQKILRKVILSERKNIWIDMHQAPTVARDFLTPLVLGAKALKSYNRKVTLVLSPLNYSLLQNTPEAPYFQFELAADATDSSDTPSEFSLGLESTPKSELEDSKKNVQIDSKSQNKNIDAPPGFDISENFIILNDDIVEQVPQVLPNLVQKLLKNYEKVIIDVSKLFLITPALIHSLILETINTGNAIVVRLQNSMVEMLQSNPQALVLNLDILSEETAQETATIEKLDAGEENFSENQIPQDAIEIEEIEDIEDIKKNDEEDTHAISSPLQGFAEEIAAVAAMDIDSILSPNVENDGTPSNFRIEINCLKANEMTESSFIRDFPKYFEELLQCGNLVYIDITLYRRIEKEIVKLLVKANWLALERGTKVVLKMLREQRQVYQNMFPHIEEVELKLSNMPEFILVGSRLELHNVTMPVFLEKFGENFKKLLGTGSSNLVVDLSRLNEISDTGIEMLTLANLEAIGKGVVITFRIKSDLEEKFQKSSRTRALPLEIIRTERNAAQEAKNKPHIDLKKIQEGDRLSQKVLKKEFETVHIESRGTFQNWEPAPIKAEEKKIVYTGPERRVEKRYEGQDAEVLFVRGSIAKFSGRKYPLHNLSQTGASFTSAVMPSRNEPVRVKIFKDDLSVEIAAKVIWVRPVAAQALFKIGVQFTKITEVGKAQLREILRKLYTSETKS